MIKAQKIIKNNDVELLEVIKKCNEINYNTATIADMYFLLHLLSTVVEHDVVTMKNACDDLKSKIQHGLKIKQDINDLTAKALVEVKGELIPIIYESLLSIENGGNKKIYCKELEENISRLYPNVGDRTPKVTSGNIAVISELETKLKIAEAMIAQLKSENETLKNYIQSLN
jgi:hypothetical protein